jgi:mycothiol synthase
MSRVRRLGPEDAEDILGIRIAGDLVDLGESDTEITSVLSDLALPGAEWLGIDDERGLAGYAWVGVFPSHMAVELEIRLRPDAVRALGPRLLALARDVAGSVGSGRPVQSWVHSTDAERTGWLTDAGGHEVRNFWRMMVDLGDDAPPSPVLPDDVSVMVVGDDESRERAVYEIVEAAFADHYGHDPTSRRTFEEFVERMHGQPGHDPTLWWLAMVGDQPAAALIGTRAMTGLGFVNTLGTLREWRGRSLGRALLRTAFAEMHRRGDRRVGLVVDATNVTGAVALYESVGMRVEHTWVVFELEPLPATR